MLADETPSASGVEWGSENFCAKMEADQKRSIKILLTGSIVWNLNQYKYKLILRISGAGTVLRHPSSGPNKKTTPFGVAGDLAETRTLDPLIKSQLLYQLSYEVKFSTTNPEARFARPGPCFSWLLRRPEKLRLSYEVNI